MKNIFLRERPKMPKCPPFRHFEQAKHVHSRSQQRSQGEWVGWRGYSLSIGMSTKMQNGKNTTFFAHLRLFYALEWTK